MARDTGQVYNTTFRFIRQNKGILVKSITYFIMPFVLIASFLISNSIGEIISIFVNGIDGNWITFFIYLVQILFGALTGYLAYSGYITLIYEFMRLYHEAADPRTITLADVWKATRKRFLIGFANVLLWGVIVSVFTGMVYFFFYFLMIIGVFLGAALNSTVLMAVFYITVVLIEYVVIIYIQVTTFPMIFISAFERVDIFTAFGRSFNLVNRKRNFLNAFGVTITGGLILFILRYIAILPATIIIGIIGFNSLDASDMEPGGIGFMLLFKVLIPVLTLLYYYSFMVFLIAEGFETTSLDERLNAKGLLNKVDKLGTHKDSGPEFYEVSY